MYLDFRIFLTFLCFRRLGKGKMLLVVGKITVWGQAPLSVLHKSSGARNFVHHRVYPTPADLMEIWFFSFLTRVSVRQWRDQQALLRWPAPQMKWGGQRSRWGQVASLTSEKWVGPALTCLEPLFNGRFSSSKLNIPHLVIRKGLVWTRPRVLVGVLPGKRGWGDGPTGPTAIGQLTSTSPRHVAVESLAPTLWHPRGISSAFSVWGRCELNVRHD